MVGEPSVAEDGRRLRAAREPRARDLVVDAPADVLRPRLAAIRPPGVLLGTRVHLAERVHPLQLSEHAVEPGALLGQEARVLPVRPPVLQVDFLVRDVDVAAQDVVAVAPRELFQVRQEGVEEAVLRGLAFRARGARRQVHRHHRQLAELELEVPSFIVELWHAEPRDDLVGFLLRQHGNAAVAGTPRVEIRAKVPAGTKACVLSWCSWALVSCRQTTSARCRASHSNSPLPAAERMPLQLSVMMRIL